MTTALMKKLTTQRRRHASNDFKAMGGIESQRSETRLTLEAFQKAFAAEPRLLMRDAGGAMSGMAASGTFDQFVARACMNGEHQKAQLHFARNTAYEYLSRDFAIKRGLGIFGTYSGGSYPIAKLHTIGWHEEADIYCKAVWANERSIEDAKKCFYKESIFGWFMTYFTLGSRDLIEGTGAQEPNAPDTPHSHLLAKWNAQDPEEVANLLLAYSENNIARAMTPSKNLEFHRTDIWFTPFDVLAINMRRLSLGLEWVDNGDPRLDDLWPVSREEQPMVQDDVIWPLYLRVCDHADIEPYKPRKTIEVKVDPETLEILEF